MHENEDFAAGMIFFAQKCSWEIGLYTASYFMHGILIHENSWAKFSFSCMGILFSFMKMMFLCMEFSCHNLFAPLLVLWRET